MNLKEAVRTLLINTGAVTGAGFLSQYDFGSGNDYAIFTRGAAPEDAATGYMTITQNGGSSQYGTRGKRGGEASLTIMVVGPNTPSGAELESFAWKVWETLHRGSLTIDGYGEHGMYADLPQELTTDDVFPGYIINVRVLVLEQ